MPSFDVVSEIDTHELTNAVDQAVRALTQRFDFKGTDATFELDDTTVTMSAPADFQLKQMLEILKLRIAKRGIDVACLEVKDPEVNLARAKQLAVLKHGIDADAGRKVSRLLKDSKLKVQAQVQGDKVRVTGKKRDDLQEAIAFLRKAEVGVPLQFNNFRACPSDPLRKADSFPQQPHQSKQLVPAGIGNGAIVQVSLTPEGKVIAA